MGPQGPDGNATEWFWDVRGPNGQNDIGSDDNDYFIDTATGDVWTRRPVTGIIPGGT
jgi:hypothetical protein